METREAQRVKPGGVAGVDGGQPTRWSTIPLSKVNLYKAIDFRANLVTQPLANTGGKILMLLDCAHRDKSREWNVSKQKWNLS